MSEIIKKIRIGSTDYNLYDVRVPDNAVFTDTVYVHPTVGAQGTQGLYKIRTDAEGHVIDTTAVTASDITPLITDATGNITALQTLVNKIQAELSDPTSADGLNSVLDTMQSVLNTSDTAVTNVTPAAYGTTPYLSVDNDGILTFNPGTITGGTASGTARFVTASNQGNQGSQGSEPEQG